MLHSWFPRKQQIDLFHVMYVGESMISFSPSRSVDALPCLLGLDLTLHQLLTLSQLRLTPLLPLHYHHTIHTKHNTHVPMYPNTPLMPEGMTKMVGMTAALEAVAEKCRHLGGSLSTELMDTVRLGQESVSTGTMSLVTMVTSTVAQQCTIGITPIGGEHSFWQKVSQSTHHN